MRGATVRRMTPRKHVQWAENCDGSRLSRPHPAGPADCRRRGGVQGHEGTLRTVLASLAEGATTEQILDTFPTLSADDVRAAIAFAATSAQEDLPVPETHVR